MPKVRPSEGLVVLVAGPTGAVGRDLVDTLYRSNLPIGELRLMGGVKSAGTSIEVEDEAVPIAACPSDPLRSPLFKGVHLAFFATPPAVTRAVAPSLAERGIGVIDIGGALSDAAPLIASAIGRESFDRFSESRIVSTPDPVSLALATLLSPLVALGARTARGTALVSAGLWGRDGLAELSSQVVSLFNNQTAARRVFPGGLAFDLITPVDAVDAAGWSALERQVSDRAALLSDLDPERVAITVAAVPIFAGVALSVFVGFDDLPEMDAIHEALSATSSVRVGDPVPGPRRGAGKAGLYVGRLREDPLGSGVHLWAVADNLRFGATANALGVATSLWRAGLLEPHD